MTIATFASGSQTAVIGTEHFLSSPNEEGEFSLYLDLSNMAAGDVVEVRAYKMVNAGGTARAFWFHAFYGAQPAHALIALSEWIPNALTDTNAVRFSIKQTFGTGRDYAWNVVRRTGGGAVDNSAIATAVWAKPTSEMTLAGSIGKALVDFITYATTKLALITAGAVNFTAPVDPDTLTLTIVRGDDYSDDSGRTLPTWESDDWSVLDLSAAASVTFKAKTRYGTTIFTKAMNILSDTQVRLQLTTAETAAFDTGTGVYTYDVEAVLSAAKGDDIITLAQGRMTVLPDVR